MASVLLLLAHPRTDSYNHAIAERVAAGVNREGVHLMFHDLHAEGFDPLIRPAESFALDQSMRSNGEAPADPLLDQHRRELAAADALAVVHPNWWGKPPAILAGWLDRVPVPGVAYRLSSPGKPPELLLKVQKMLIVNTTDTSELREQEVFGDPLAAMWERCVASYLGSDTEPTQVERHVLACVNGADDAQRSRWLDRIENASARLASSLR